MQKNSFRFYSIVLSLVFSLWLCVPLFIDLLQLSPYVNVSKSENRVLAKRPVPHFALLDPYPSEYQIFYNDHFPFRSGLLHGYAYINYFYFHKYSIPNGAVIGKSDWLFYAAKEREVYEGKLILLPEYIENIVANLHARTDHLNKMGIPFYVVIVPMKSEVYAEFLPVYYRKSRQNIPDAVLEAIRKDTSIRLIDLKPALIEAKKKGQIFYKTDTHWNALGAYCAYKEIMNRLQRDFQRLAPMAYDDISFSTLHGNGGNLAAMMGLSEFLKEDYLIDQVKQPMARDGKKAGYPPTPGFGYPDEYEQVKINFDTTLPTLLVIRDSYFTSLIQFFSQHFSKSVYIFDAWKYKPNYDIIEKEKPDIVILEIVATNLSDLIVADSKFN